MIALDCLSEIGSAARRPVPLLTASTRRSSRLMCRAGPTLGTRSIDSASIVRPLALCTRRTSGPVLTTTLFSTRMVFSILVLLMITRVLAAGTA